MYRFFKQLIYLLAFWIYAFVISAYFSLLEILSFLRIKPHIRLVENPDLLSLWFVRLWNAVPPNMKIWLSTQNKKLYESHFTKFYINAYLHRNYKEDNYLNKFKPPLGKQTYECFQDFFTREFAEEPDISSDSVAPAEGLVCDKQSFFSEKVTNIKGENIGLRSVFGSSSLEIPNNYFFTNIYLSNRNYHHIHAPISGTITKIEKIDGDLIVLRPWYYHQNPSKPALINERVNINIKSEDDLTWYLSIVGGPVVNSIILPEDISIGTQVSIGQKLASFELGSTCCIASPLKIKTRTNEAVEIFSDF